MKKLLSLFLTFTMLLSLCLPSLAEAGTEASAEKDVDKLLDSLGTSLEEAIGITHHEITSKTFPLYKGNEKVEKDLKLYFLNAANDLPYMEVNDLLPLLNLVYEGDLFTMSAEDAVVTFNRHSALAGGDVPAYIDFDNNVIKFMDYNLFIAPPASSTIMDIVTMPVRNEAGEYLLLEKVDNGAFARYGDEVNLMLGEYGIDLVQQDGLYLIPLQTISDFFFAPAILSSFYFNGQCVIVTDNIKDQSDLYYAAPTGERSKALAEYGYNELCLMLDTLYGLKGTHDITSFDKLFNENGFASLIKGDKVNDADKAIYRLITDYLDDNHSLFYGFSYLNGVDDYSVTGISHGRLGNFRQRQLDARAKYYPDGVPGYEEIGNTAYITFDDFNVFIDDPKEFYAMKDPMDFSDSETIGLIIKAHSQITRENSPIENVVIDLSANGGGTADAAAFILSWFLGEASVGLKDTMTGAMCVSTYKADANLDHVFDEKDSVSDKNLFCLISPFSFSCGNLVPCMFKESGLVTLLGRTSGGGTCYVQPISSAWGTSFRISAPRQLSFLKNGSFYDVDRGADPDYTIATPEKYYDRQALTDYINTLF